MSNPGFHTDTHWRRAIAFVDRQGVPIDLTDREFTVQVFDRDGGLIYSFDNSLDPTDNGAIDNSRLADGYVIIDATKDQHAQVSHGSYSWKCRETLAGTDRAYSANGILIVAPPQGTGSRFDVLNASNGSIASAVVVGMPGSPGASGAPGVVTPELQALLAAAQAAAAASLLAEGRSESARDTALGYATDAETAAAWVIAHAAGFYADTTAGLAATAEGSYFAVPGGSGTASYAILYRKVAGAAVEIDRAPNLGAVQGIFDVFGIGGTVHDYAYGVAIPIAFAGDGRFDTWLSSFGGIGTARLQLGLIPSDNETPYCAEITDGDQAWMRLRKDRRVALVRENERQLSRDMRGNPFRVETDEWDNLFYRLNADGSIYLRLDDDAVDYLKPKIGNNPTTLPEDLFSDSAYAAPSLGRVIDADPRGLAAPYVYRLDRSPPALALAELERPLQLMAGYGQSLSIGVVDAEFYPPGTDRAVTTMAVYPHYGVMPSTGTVNSSSSPLDTSPIVDLVPLKENALIGESQGSSMVRWLMAKDIAGAGPLDPYLFWSSGFSGRKLAELSKGTVHYDNLLRMMKRMKELAAGVYGAPSCELKTLFWTQGEADRDVVPLTTRTAYRDALLQLVADLNTDVKAILNQSADVHLIIDQLCSADEGAGNPSGGGPGLPALAQFDAVEMDSRLHLSCVKYFLQNAYGIDHFVHLKPLGYALLGEYQAKARRNLLAGLPTTLSVNRAGITRVGTIFTIPTFGRSGSLLIDTGTLPAVPGNGFTHTAGAITSVTPAGDNIIVIGPDAPGTLAYGMDRQSFANIGRASAWGNLRDSCDEDSIAVPGLKLRNWLPHFDIVLA